MKAYKTSKDYLRFKQLLEEGYKIICFAKYKVKLEENIFIARMEDADSVSFWGDKFYFISRDGVCLVKLPGTVSTEGFSKICEDLEVEYLEPNNYDKMDT